MAEALDFFLKCGLTEDKKANMKKKRTELKIKLTSEKIRDTLESVLHISAQVLEDLLTHANHTHRHICHDGTKLECFIYNLTHFPARLLEQGAFCYSVNMSSMLSCSALNDQNVSFAFATRNLISNVT